MEAIQARRSLIAMHLRFFRILMNLETGGPGGGAPAASGAGAGQQTQQTGGQPAPGGGASSAAAPPGTPSAGAAPSGPTLEQLQGQLAALATTVEKLAKAPPAAAAGQGAAAGAAPDANAIAAQVTAQVTFNTQVANSGATAEQQAAVRQLYDLEKPAPDKLGEWMKAKLSLFGVKAPGGAPPQQSNVRTDLGAPGARPGDPNALPADPRLVPKNIWAGMTSEQRLDITNKWKASQGGAGLMRNPNRK